jgi:hypothetical protein
MPVILVAVAMACSPAISLAFFWYVLHLEEGPEMQSIRDGTHPVFRKPIRNDQHLPD